MHFRWLAFSLLSTMVGAIAAPAPVVSGDRHWAFRELEVVGIPTVRDQAWVQTPVDAFVLAKLETEGVRPAAEADPRTWLRRVYLDLLGLPPTPADVERFLVAARDAPLTAKQEVADDLLARPQYGERWGRHWLDVVRYAETHGYEFNERKPDAWRYRDYVIDSFNQDKPYDRFVVEQLAGDELEGATDETRIAALFLRLGPFDTRPGIQAAARYDQLDDVLGTVSAVFMGQTLQCARCHDHLFEPFSQADYYRTLALLGPLKHFEQDKFSLGRPGPPVTLGRVLVRGEASQLGAAVTAGLPEVLAESQDSASPMRSRLDLAKWLTGEGQALAARVLVNRVWHYHFGRGLVATPNDFGQMGDAPTHPELLEWLAQDFVAGGWRLKRLHRLIVLSNTYAQGSTPAATSTDDPEEKLLARWRPRRLEAEAVRDSILAVSGELCDVSGGLSVLPPLSKETRNSLDVGLKGMQPTTDERQLARRSVYLFAPRARLVPELDVLDRADASASCDQRSTSTNALQALQFLNGAFAQQQSRHFSARLLREAGGDSTSQIELAFALALARQPQPDELRAALDFLAAQQSMLQTEGLASSKLTAEQAHAAALAAFCLVLMNTNEFVYLN